MPEHLKRGKGYSRCIGWLCTETHWLRGVTGVGGPPRALFFIEEWWPLTDPAPGKDGR